MNVSRDNTAIIVRNMRSDGSQSRADYLERMQERIDYLARLVSKVTADLEKAMAEQEEWEEEHGL